MRRPSVATLGLVAVLTITGRAEIPLPQGARPAAPVPAAVSGVVTDGATKQPVAGAFVELARTDAGRTNTRRVDADSQGRFVFTDLEPGAGYSMTAGGSGYVTTAFGWEPGGSDAILQRFALTAGEWKRDLSLRVWRRPSISGRVSDEHGEPVVGVTVGAYTTELITAVPRAVAAGPLATTDDRGLYRLVNLEPGSYRVGVLSVQSTVAEGAKEAAPTRAIGGLWTGGYGIGDGPIVVSPLIDGRGRHRLAITNYPRPPAPVDGQNRAYPAVYYPGVRSLADAEAVVVAWGDERREINLQLQPVPGFVVSGRIDGPLESPLLLRLLPVGLEHLGFGSEAATTATEKDGGFTFLNVPAGVYTLLGQGHVFDFAKGASGDVRIPDAPGFPSALNGGGTWAGTSTSHFLNRMGIPVRSFIRTGVTVGADLTDLVLRSGPTATIRGRVVYTDGAQPPTGRGILIVRAEPLSGDPSLGNPESNRVDASGVFAIEGVLPGRYRLWVPGRIMSSVLWQGRDVLDAGIEIAAGQSADDVTVTFTGKPARVVATVTGLDPERRAAAIVFPADSNAWTNYGWNPSRLLSLTTDAAGSADFTRLPAGEYLVIAVPSSQAFAWTDPTFLAAAAPLATRVTVNWGESRSVALPLRMVVVR